MLHKIWIRAGVLCWLASVFPDAAVHAAPATLSELAQKTIPSVVAITSTRKSAHGMGSGVILREDGLILTSHHVVDGAGRIQVSILGQSRVLEASLLAGDSRTDIALIKLRDLPPIRLHPLKMGDSDRLKVGDPVYAVGNPFGFRHSVTSGIISARGRNGSTLGAVAGGVNESAPEVDDLLQTDAAINPGNSGGPLINSQGEMIGLNAAIFSQTGGFLGIGFAIPSKELRRISEELLQKGRIIRGWIGVTAQNLDPTLANLLGSTEPSGALVSDIKENGPASKAKVLEGDILLRFDGSPTPDALRLKQVVSRTSVGKKARIEILRDGKHETLDVTVAEQPTAPGDPLPPPAPSPSPEIQIARAPKDLGLTLQSVPRDLKEIMLLPSNRGVLITQVHEGSLAAEAGLTTGDVLLSINRESCSSLEQAHKQIHSALAQKTPRPLLLLVQRGPGDRLFVALPASATLQPSAG